MAEIKLGNKTIFSESGGTLTAHNLPKQMAVSYTHLTLPTSG